MPLSVRFNHGTQQEYTEGKKCQMFVAHRGIFFSLSQCQLKLMIVREKMVEAEGPCNYYFLEPNEVQDPL